MLKKSGLSVVWLAFLELPCKLVRAMRRAIRRGAGKSHVAKTDVFLTQGRMVQESEQARADTQKECNPGFKWVRLLRIQTISC